MRRASGKRRRGAVREHLQWPASSDSVRGQEGTNSELHDERLDAVMDVLLRSGVSSVLDLGCGSGALLRRLVEYEQFTRIVGIDTSAEALSLADQLLSSRASEKGPRWSLEHCSFAAMAPEPRELSAVTLVETIEHIAPRDLSALEQAVLGIARPMLVLITTPNREYNVLYGLSEGELRHEDHEFEWDRGKFRAWSSGAAERNGYQVILQDIGRSDPLLGSPTQMAIFRRRDEI